MIALHFVIATAGHVDHGKSALVKSLTGTDPDRLPEEKARGITIDLGFAFLPMTASDGSSIVAGIVDVPGHEDFVRNMIAGVGSIDLALLVVAADDGWMPQTEEHLQILMHLRVSRLLVAITKADLSPVGKVEEEIRRELASTPFAGARIMATSIHGGSGISELKEAIQKELSALTPERREEKARLSIDRAFSLRGVGTVVTGTLAGGSLRSGQAVTIQPGNIATRIRSIQTGGREIDTAPPAARTALNLPDISIGESADAIKRGDVVTTVVAESSSTLDVLLEALERQTSPGSKARPIKTYATVDVHHGTSRTAAQIVLLDQTALLPGEQAFAQLRLSAPLFAFLGDRFVIRDRSQQHTLAGGVVLDPDARRESFRSEAQQAFLRARRSGWEDVDVCAGSEIARNGFAVRETLLRKSKFGIAEIAESIDRLCARGRALALDDIVADSAMWQKLRERAVALIDHAHAANPNLPGLDLSAFRSAFRDYPAEILEALLTSLSEKEFVRKGQTIARRSHQSVLPPELEPVAAKIRSALADHPFDPPARRLVAPDRAAQQALQFLISTGAVVDVSSDVVLQRHDLDAMKAAIGSLISKSGASHHQPDSPGIANLAPGGHSGPRTSRPSGIHPSNRRSACLGRLIRCRNDRFVGLNRMPAKRDPNSDRVQLHLGPSFEAAWENVILPWFKTVALAGCSTDRPTLVVVPYQSRAQFFRHLLIDAGLPLLGVEFVAPQQLREILLRATDVKVPLREHLRLILSIAAEQSLEDSSKSDTSPMVMAARAVLREPDHLLRTIDELNAAGWPFAEVGPKAFRPLVDRFDSLVQHCGFTSIQAADRLAARKYAHR